jgi:MATE family multidrug resistance protein
MVSNVSVPLLGAVDTAVVGHLPDPKYLGAVAVGAMVFNLLYWGLGFLRMGTAGFAAQAHGAGNADEVRAVPMRGLMLAVGLGAAMVVAQAPIGTVAFTLLDASPAVEGLARDYFATRIVGAPAALANYVLLGWFVGVQRPRLALVVNLWMNGVNIALDVLFVVGFGWAVVGVAWATVIAEVSAAVVALLLMRGHLARIGGRFDRRLILEPAALRRTLAFNGDIFLRTLCLVGAFLYFTARGAAFGEVTLAANAVLLNFLTFASFVLDAFAYTVQALAGGAIGKREGASFRAAVRASSESALVTAAVFTALYAVLGPVLIDLLTGIDAVRLAARDYAWWAVGLPLVAVWAYQLDGIFLAAIRGRTMRNAMLVSVAAYAAMCATMIPILGNHGLWASLMAFMAIRGVTLGVRYPALARSVVG